MGDKNSNKNQLTYLDLKKRFEAARQILHEESKTSLVISDQVLEEYFVLRERLKSAESKLLV